jgi:hypothetical protein
MATPHDPTLRARVLSFHRDISVPRLVGSPGEAYAQRVITDAFAEVPGTTVTTQEFVASRAYMCGVLNLVHPLIGVLALVTFGLAVSGHLGAALGVNSLLLLASLFNRQLIQALQFRVRRVGKLYETKNLIAEVRPQSPPERTIVILAHHDSISHRLSPVLEGVGYATGFLLCLGFSIHVLIYVVPVLLWGVAPASPWVLVWGVVVGTFAMVELVNTKGNQSNGAVDNASGVTQMYHLAHRVAAEPLQRTRLLLVATGAEELGDYGAEAFVAAYRSELDVTTTQFLVVDSLGLPEGNTVFYGIGAPVRHWSPELEAATRAELAATLIPVKMMAIPPLLQVSTDHVPVEQAGYPFLLYASTAFFYHSLRDSVDALHPDNFFHLCALIERVIRRLDRGD